MDNLVNNYQEIKEALRNDLNQLAQSFVVIGYRLKKIRDEELYKIDGYKTITEFAQAEYNLSQTATSRFIAINDRYSVDGSSPKLLPEYEGYGYSKLSEMLTLSEDELKLISIRTTRAEIREIKQAKKEAEEENYAPAHNFESLDSTQLEDDFSTSKNFIIPDADKLLIEFFRDKSRRHMLKELAAVLAGDINSDPISKAIEIINPSGHLMFRKGLIILMFEEDHIKYSKFGSLNTQFTYEDLFRDIYATFDMTQPDPWVCFYGEPEPEPEPEKKAEDNMKSEKVIESKKPEVKPPAKNQPKPINTQSKSEKDKHKEVDATNEQLPGQMHITDYPEVIPDNENKEDLDVEVIEADIVDNVDKSSECKACSGQTYKFISTEDLTVEIDHMAAVLNVTVYKDGQPTINKISIKYCPS